MKAIRNTVLCGFAMTLFSTVAQTASVSLEGRLPATPGGTDYQAYYDPILNITWAAAANAGGLANWDAQVAWAASLNLGGVSGWRLPDGHAPIAGTFRVQRRRYSGELFSWRGHWLCG